MMSAVHSQSSSDALIVISANIEGLKLIKHPYYQSCARINIATVYVSLPTFRRRFNLSSSKWGTNACTIRTTALALSYSVVEYAAPVWARSAHAYKLDSELNIACRAITGCLKPTNVEELYLSGIAPPSIRRDVCARVKKAKQETNEAHSLYGQIPAEKSRNDFLHSVNPANFPPKVIRCSEWLRRTNKTPQRTSVNLDESLARGHDSPWTTDYLCSKEQRKKWQYFDGGTTC